MTTCFLDCTQRHAERAGDSREVSRTFVVQEAGPTPQRHARSACHVRRPSVVAATVSNCPDGGRGRQVVVVSVGVFGVVPAAAGRRCVGVQAALALAPAFAKVLAERFEGTAGRLMCFASLARTLLRPSSAARRGEQTSSLAAGGKPLNNWALLQIPPLGNARRQ